MRGSQKNFKKALCYQGAFLFFFLLHHGGGDEGVEGFSLGGELLHLDEEGDAVAHKLEELDLGVADTISVGTVVGGGVDTTGTTLLETEEVEDGVQLLLVLGQG